MINTIMFLRSLKSKYTNLDIDIKAYWINTVIHIKII
nr:ALPV-038 [Albatrosspox virus]